MNQDARTKGDSRPVTCAECDDAIDRCEFCDDPDCPRALCYRCLHVGLGDIVPQPHAHGG
jgi:hypothetical protein